MNRKNMKDSDWAKFPNFRKTEFLCPKHCNGQPSEIAYSLIEFMQKLRSHYNRPIHINSGLRCREFNAELRGSSQESDHLNGLACDFNFENHVFTKQEKDQVMTYMRTLPNIKYCYTNQSNMYNGIHVSVYPTYEENSKPTSSTKKYIKINTGAGVWCRLNCYGFNNPKYKVIPYNTKCELLVRNIGTSNGYSWDKVMYENKIVYLPNRWNSYL